MKVSDLYPFVPTWAQDALCSLYGYRLIRRRYGNGYDDLARTVLARGRLEPDELRRLRDERLRRTVQRAAEKVPYYRRLFRDLRLDPRDIRAFGDLARLPILTKPQVQENLAEFCSDDRERLQTTTTHTSGTTGTGLVFPMTLEAEQEQWAVWWRYRQRFGIYHSTWYAHFYGRSVVPLSQMRPPFWRVNYPGRQILFSGYHMSDRYLGYYVEELNRRRPPWIQGYPSLLSLLAGYMQSSGNRLAYRPDIVTVGAESLLPHQKRSIEEAFGTTCRQHYSTTEAVANISECPEGRLHVDEDFSAVEFVPDEQGTVRIIGTGFANDAFVLIRYQVGDNVVLPRVQPVCPCGNPGRVVESIDGRIEDYVVTRDGRRLGRLDHILKDMVNVRECQIVQTEVGQVEFRVVRGPRFGRTDREALLEEARKRLGDDTRIDITYAETLERSNTGKLRFVVSRVAGNAVKMDAT